MNIHEIQKQEECNKNDDRCMDISEEDIYSCIKYGDLYKFPIPDIIN